NQKFSELRYQYNNTNQTIKNKNRNHKDSLLEIYHLSEIFKQFRLVPKQFDYLVNNMRSMMKKIRIQERHIMKLCIEKCKMPKKYFIQLFSGE
ncbi:MAG: sigma-70 non-essential region-containing protein, partial [Candidatus Blochmannia sp. A2]|nr:sigma-70 non-essential region-containing protein [Candidatus Blochmannia sp. A2]